MIKSVKQLLLDYHCKAIANCPGRYIIKDIGGSVGIEELLSDKVDVSYYTSRKARDEIAVVSLDGGGLISYIRSDGSILHTVNNESGFSRKLRDLEIQHRQDND